MTNTRIREHPRRRGLLPRLATLPIKPPQSKVNTTGATNSGFNQRHLISAIDSLGQEGTDAWRQRRAWAHLLDFMLRLDRHDDPHRLDLELCIQARVLVRLKHYVAKRKFAGLSGCCDHDCVLNVVLLALTCVLFYVAREPGMAVAFIQEGLHRFLIERAQQGMLLTEQEQTLASISDLSGLAHAARVPTALGHRLQSQDVGLVLDPFDWSYRSLAVALREDGEHEFVLPIGTRSLIHVLRGDRIPANEVDAFEMAQPATSVSPTAAESPRGRQRPSIFAFASTERLTPDQTNELCQRVQDGIDQRRTTAHTVAADAHSQLHYAVRALALLSRHLHKPLVERRRFIEARLVPALCNMLLPFALGVWAAAADGANNERGEQQHRDDELLAAIAAIALTEFSLDEVSQACRGVPPQLRTLAEFIVQQHQASKRYELPPDTGSEGPGVINDPTLSLEARLHRAQAEAKRESQLQLRANQARLAHEHQVARSERRHQLRHQCHAIEELRSHLLDSLHVMRTGRRHPVANQRFMDWIESFTTIEKQEAERQYREQLHQEHLQRLQQEQAKMRRREREERELMRAQDHDVRLMRELQFEADSRQQRMQVQKELQKLQEDEEERQLKVLEQRIRSHEEDQRRMAWIRQRKREAKELEFMAREDTFYVDKIARLKEEQRTREQLAKKANVIDEQQQKIDRMRRLDHETKAQAKELERMRHEDFEGRQWRMMDMQQRQQRTQNEYRNRKAMEAAEKESRAHWELWRQQEERLQQEVLKQQRIEARLKRKQQEREQRAREQLANSPWLECVDGNGDTYFYNQATGSSQWEHPFL